MVVPPKSIATQVEENSNKHSLEPPKIKKFSRSNSPPLFNVFSISIKEIPSVPRENWGDNNTKNKIPKDFTCSSKIQINYIIKHKCSISIDHPAIINLNYAI